MDWNGVRLAWGAAAALLVGFSKTGVPGAAIPAVALMAEAFRSDTRLSVGAMLPVLLVGDAFAILFYRRHAQWNRLGELAPFVALGMVPGYIVLGTVDSDALRMLLGMIVLVLLGLHLLSRRWGTDFLANHSGFGPAAGLVAGFGTAVGNAAGPVMSIYLVSRKLDKHQFMGTAAWFFAIVNLSKVPVFGGMGLITTETLRLDGLVVPVVVAGAFLGAAVLKRIPQLAFDVLVLLLAGAAGLRLVLT
ncbi:MAG TPA: sulfite exporter TauE/SafE family protein [Planctomycetaceae bacterium]|nr:sulfite exporter TauE/SafE family protein [Planctomycetaceae bacterium]